MLVDHKLVAPVAIESLYQLAYDEDNKKISPLFNKSWPNFFKFQFMSTFAISCNRQRKTGERRKS